MRALLLACALVAASAAPALSDEDVRISTAGRDLSSPTEVAELHAQIERVARRVCGRMTYAARANLQRMACIREKVDNAVRTANVPALTALHEERTQTARS